MKDPEEPIILDEFEETKKKLLRRIGNWTPDEPLTIRELGDALNKVIQAQILYKSWTGK